jgi:tetratricopeptide (TPR) repeat protein
MLERAVELAEGRQRARALVALADLLPEVGEFAPAFETAIRAIQAAESAGDRASVLRATLVRILTEGSVDPSRTMAQGLEEAERVLAEAQALGDPDVRDRAVQAVALERFFLGQTAAAIELMDELFRRAATMSRSDRVEITGQLVVNSYFGSSPVLDALQVLDRTAEVRGDSIAARAHDLRVRGALVGMLGRFEEARSMFEEADGLFDELGAPQSKVTTSQVVAETFRLERRFADAERILREMNATYDAMGETGFNSTVCALLAHVLCDQGRFDEAETFVARSHEMSAEDDFASQASWRMARARVLTDRGLFDEALGSSDEAVAIIEGTDYVDWQGQAHEVRALVLEAAGRGEEARDAFEQALDRFQRKGDQVATERLRARLGTPRSAD